jgi:hypothetical protein
MITADTFVRRLFAQQIFRMASADPDGYGWHVTDVTEFEADGSRDATIEITLETQRPFRHASKDEDGQYRTYEAASVTVTIGAVEARRVPES